VIRAIGPAPKAGRPRWLELAALLADPALAQVAADRMGQPPFRHLSSDARFDAVLTALRQAHAGGNALAGTDPQQSDMFHNAHDMPALDVSHTARGVRIAVDERVAPGLSAFLLEELPGILRRYNDRSGR
jgi:ParB family chromosome partitioning protein